ncbi:MAG: aminopeptidase P N-terminal domain-containing protein [Sulfurimonas sp.]|uniref:aminopeptidase P N-terminal domain-containing protein n=1 Tax=Sulfurimonas sp. TaxID=2022749 RepID=UPI0025D06F52|nr:aminopeptidase P N-terminal domain-containing protein [Sulfurimonas sp.]MCK9492283.1 aminopeptidase P N-terminal domain-containing protein [Sulfurimonas sp.]
MIKESEYKKRRTKLAKKLSNNSVALLFSAKAKVRSNDTNYLYRQDSNFYYLTGFKEDNACLVFLKSRKKIKTILFVQKKDAQEELWNGKRLGVVEAKKRFLFDEVRVSSDLKKSVKEFCKDKENLYFDFTKETPKIKKSVKRNFIAHYDISIFIKEMRLIKSKAEIKFIKKAIKITKKAHHNAMKFKKIGSGENELLAKIEYTFKKNGAYSDAYTSIVACGDSANTLHYISNNKDLKNKELILIDAGCEYDYYASDITRTIPVNGKFTKAQRDLYELVLDTQKKVIEMIKPKILRSDLQKKAEILLVDGMIKLGIMSGKRNKLIKKLAHKKYYPHGIGHWMGLDVHDEAPYFDKNKKEIALRENMILTIEPGIYISKDDKNVPKKFRGIGIRIEDDIQVTKRSHKNLSKKIAKSIEEVEAKSRRT